MSGGYAQLKQYIRNDKDQPIKKPIKRPKTDQALKAKNRALKKLGNKAAEFLSKWEVLKDGNDKQKADGFIASLVAQGYSHIEVQSLLKIGGSRVARLSKPDWSTKRERRPPPAHAAKDEDISAIREHLSTWNVETGYGCSHNSEIEYLTTMIDDEKHLSWKVLYRDYVRLQNEANGRVLSYNRWLDYVRYFRPNLKLSKSLAQASCSKCFPGDGESKMKKPSATKRKRKGQAYHLLQSNVIDGISSPKCVKPLIPASDEFNTKKRYAYNKPFCNMTNTFSLDSELAVTNTSWTSLMGLDTARQRVDDLGLLNTSLRPGQCDQYLQAPVPSSSFHAPTLSSANEYFPNEATFFMQNSCEFFPLGVNKIPYAPNANPDQTMCFKHYNENEVVLGRTMKDWLRFSVCFWHTFRGVGADPFGLPTITRHWDNGSNSLDNARQRLRAAFEFFSKLGVPYWTFHDRDIAPEGMTLSETNRNLDELTDLALELQQQTGVRLLWNTCNLFSHPRYMNGAATSNDAHVFAYAAAQVKKGLETAKKLGAQNFVFWGGREGFQSLLNTDITAELDHLSKFFKMVVDYKAKIGFTGQLLIEPKAKEPLKHQYDYDAMTVIGFLDRVGLKRHFKINVEPNHTMLAGHDYCHDIKMASVFGMLGSIDANTGSPELGWDTDQFPSDLRNSALLLKIVIEQGGIQPGGLNFDCKLRRESTDVYDMFIAHIGAMDTLARGLKTAAKIIEDGILDRTLKNRYLSFATGIGKKIHDGATNLEELEKYVLEAGEPTQQSGKQEHFEAMLNHYL